MIETKQYAKGTSLVQTYPWGFYLGGRALCSDGKVRALKRISSTADTFFSVPASVEVRRDGKRYTVAGFITLYDETVEFRAYEYRKNGHLLL